MKLLIIDDDPVVRHILGAILTGLGHEHQSASSGGEGLTLLRSGASPDAVFLDMMLGDTTGVQVLGEIRRTISPCPMVIMLSANLASEALADPELNPDYYLEKPFTSSTVVEALTAIEST